MARELTVKELAIMTHVVVDPAEWWEHANKPERKTPAEDALKAKLARHEPQYDKEKAKSGYKTRAAKNVDELNDIMDPQIPEVTLTSSARTKLEARMSSGQVDKWAGMKVKNGGQGALDEALANME